MGDDNASLGLLLLSLTVRCTSLAQEGAPVMGVSPVWPSIMASRPKLNTFTPLEGVVIGMPVLSVTTGRVVATLGLMASEVGLDEGGLAGFSTLMVGCTMVLVMVAVVLLAAAV